MNTVRNLKDYKVYGDDAIEFLNWKKSDEISLIEAIDRASAKIDVTVEIDWTGNIYRTKSSKIEILSPNQKKITISTENRKTTHVGYESHARANHVE